MKNALNNMGGYVRKHSPIIMTSLGVVGVISTAVMAVKATPEAMRLIEEAHGDRNVRVEEESYELDVIDTIKIAWRPYAPAILMGTITIACIINANQINAKRNAALAGVYSLTENRLREYQRQVVETVGEKKEKEVRDNVAKAELDKNPMSGDITVTSEGDMLCYESLSGRYFRSDVESIKRVFNELNRRIVNNNYMYVYVNDFYEDLGLSSTIVGDLLGWGLDDGEIEPIFSSQLTDKKEPCLVVSFSVDPTAEIS